MKTHVERAISIYEQQGTDFQKITGWHFCHGVVFSDALAFGLAHYADSRDLSQAVEFHHSDTFFVNFITGDMAHALSPFASHFKFIAFQRQFKNSDRVRLHEMTSFMKKLQHR